MAKDSSFDVVSQVDMQEMDNAVNQTKKEIAQRYDFRGSDASIELEEKCIKLAAEEIQAERYHRYAACPYG